MPVTINPAFLWRGALAAVGSALPRGKPGASRPDAVKASKRIALLGNFGTGNTGNESTLAAMLQTLRRIAPQSSVTCVCYAPAVVERDHGIATVPLNPRGSRTIAFRIFNRLLLRLPQGCVRAYQMLAVLLHTDVLIVPGTGSLDDFGVPPFDWPFHLFKWCAGARLLGVKVAFTSTGAGPIGNPISRFFLKLAAASATYRSFRDEPSRAFVQGLGLDTSKDLLFPDLVFALRRELPAPVPRPGSRCAGVGIMSYKGWKPSPIPSKVIYDAYLSKMCAFVLWLRAQGWDVRLFGGDAVDDEAISDLTKRIEAETGPSSAWLTTTLARSSSKLLAEIAQVDRVVATRFHNVLWSLMMRKPVISIGYAEKNRLLMTEMGLGDYCHDIGSFEVADLIRHFEDIGRNQDALVSGLAARIKARELALARQETIIATQLLGTP